VMLGVISVAMEGPARTKMEPGKLNRYFIFGSYGSDSPDRTEVTKLAIAKAGRLHGRDLAVDEVYVVGDTPLDITSAHAAHATALGVTSGHYNAGQLRAAHPAHVLGSLTEPFPGLATRPHPATTHDATDTRRCVDPRRPSPAALVRTEGHRRGNSSRSAEHERGCSARRFHVGPRPGWYQRRAPLISLRYASSPGCRPRPATDRSGIGRGSPTRSATHRAEASGVVVSGSALPVCGAR